MGIAVAVNVAENGVLTGSDVNKEATVWPYLFSAESEGMKLQAG